MKTSPAFMSGRHDAGARRHGGCLQSSSKWVRLPPASLTDQLLARITSTLGAEKYLSQNLVGRSQDTLNCLSGLHPRLQTWCHEHRLDDTSLSAF